MKKIWIVFIIIIFVICLDSITEKYTNKFVAEMNFKISKMKEKLKNNDINVDIEELLKVWKKHKNILAFYMEHEELEEISSNLNLLNDQIEQGKYLEAINLINEIEFLTKIVEEKQKLTWENLF